MVEGNEADASRHVTVASPTGSARSKGSAGSGGKPKRDRR
jgi:hypothetical protein